MTTKCSAAKVVAGVDTHADTHHVAVVDAATGGVLGDNKFPTGRAGYTALLAFVCAFGQVLRFGVEGTNSYGAGLSRHLRAAGHTVAEVVRPNRADRRLRGKSDPLDAISAARTAMAPDRLPTPKTSDGVVEAVRGLLTTRRSAVKARTGAMRQICSILVSAPDSVREQYEPLPAKTRLERLRRLRPSGDSTDVHAVTSRCLKQLATRCADLDREINSIDASLRQAIGDTAPALLAAHGIGVVTAATLLVTADDNPERVTTEAGLAALCGVSPIPASSGKTTRHRLNRGGDRQANCDSAQKVPPTTTSSSPPARPAPRRCAYSAAAYPIGCSQRCGQTKHGPCSTPRHLLHLQHRKLQTLLSRRPLNEDLT